MLTRACQKLTAAEATETIRLVIARAIAHIDVTFVSEAANNGNELGTL